VSASETEPSEEQITSLRKWLEQLKATGKKIGVSKQELAKLAARLAQERIKNQGLLLNLASKFNA